LDELAALPKFASTLLEEAKRFIEKATEAKEPAAKLAYLHAGLLVGFAAFEAHVNAMCDDFLSSGGALASRARSACGAQR
jgi:hypothetical protein